VLELHGDELDSGRHQATATVHPSLGGDATHFEVDAHLFKKGGDEAERKVLVVGMDGVRADALLQSQTPTLDFLATRGAFSYEAHTQLKAKTKSGPGWASVMTGVDADKHGVSSNETADLEGHDPAYPSFLERAHVALGSRSVAAAHWVPVLLLTAEDVFQEVALGDDDSVTEQMAEFIKEGDFDVHFIHLDDPDAAGHEGGFAVENPLYLAAIEACDGRIRSLLQALLARPTVVDEEWLIVVTTDHGGDGFNHGALDGDNQTIFLIAAGASLVPQDLSSGASHMDVHPTVMGFLGAFPEPDWKLDGSVVGLPLGD
jgi:predicted AlkP superfamily pyrophosphatase or phosphodiesterase